MPVNNLKKQLIAYFLLLCISVNIAPSVVFHDHQHDKDSHCDSDNQEIENNPCHVSLYHSEDLQKKHCEHDFHFQNDSSECKACKFISSNTSQFIHSEITSTPSVSLFLSYFSREYAFSPYSIPQVNFNKGPPSHYS